MSFVKAHGVKNHLIWRPMCDATMLPLGILSVVMPLDILPKLTLIRALGCE